MTVPGKPLSGISLQPLPYPANGGHLRASATDTSPATLKLRKAAAEFESTLISKLWKSMKSTFDDPTDEDSTDPSKEVLDDWGIQSMSTAMANAGGLGIGQLILKDLEAKQAHSQNGNAALGHKDSPLPADISGEGR